MSKNRVFNLLLEACKAKLEAVEGKEYDPEAFDIASKLCREAIEAAEDLKRSKKKNGK